MHIQAFSYRALFFFFSLIFSGLSWGAGIVHFAKGEVNASNSQGDTRTLSKGASIAAGDTVITGASSLAQLKFTDGALVSLQPNTSFRVDDYHYEGKVDGNEKGNFSLLQGGMRIITGVIGKQNRKNHKVDAVVATIGIRGTEYTAQLDNARENLLVHTGEGLIEVSNERGSLLVASGETAEIRLGQLPQRTETRPQLPPPAIDETAAADFSSSETRTASGDLADVEINAEPSSNLYYIIGNPTSSAELMALGNVNTSYNLVSVTTPRDQNGNTATLESGTLDVGFIGGTISSTNIDLNISIDGSPHEYSGYGSTGNGANFSGNGTAFAYDGFVAGTDASRAGVTYTFTENTQHYFGAAYGIEILPPPPPPPPPPRCHASDRRGA